MELLVDLKLNEDLALGARLLVDTCRLHSMWLLEQFLLEKGHLVFSIEEPASVPRTKANTRSLGQDQEWINLLRRISDFSHILVL